jgi:hypothetical protein
MNQALSPARDHEIFDALDFGGWLSPGVVRLSGHDREQSIDIKDASGQKGATTTWKGTKVASFTATFSLVFNAADELDDFGAWDLWVARLWNTIPPRSGKKPAAVDVYHPDLARNEIKSVIVKKIGGLIHDGKGGATVAVEFQEYFPPKPVQTGAPAGTKSKAEKDAAAIADAMDPVAVANAQLDAIKKAAYGP